MRNSWRWPIGPNPRRTRFRALSSTRNTSPSEREIRIVDIALLPEHHNGGIGSAILRDILAEGARSGKRVSIHVEMFNPALGLYERLGFRKLREHGVYHFMEWSPESAV